VSARSPGAVIGEHNREAVRRFFAAHIGCTKLECARALGLSPMAVGRHVATLRGEWSRHSPDAGSPKPAKG
jgi:predicted ArsR family transcriptional regulator